VISVLFIEACCRKDCARLHRIASTHVDRMLLFSNRKADDMQNVNNTCGWRIGIVIGPATVGTPKQPGTPCERVNLRVLPVTLYQLST
jgi:hypothetical protein